MRHRKRAAVIAALVLAVIIFTGCTDTNTPASVLYDADGLKIEQDGTQTRIYDFDGSQIYYFTEHRYKVPAGKVSHIGPVKTTTDTDTVKIQTAAGLIIVEVKATGEILYIR